MIFSGGKLMHIHDLTKSNPKKVNVPSTYSATEVPYKYIYILTRVILNMSYLKTTNVI